MRLTFTIKLELAHKNLVFGYVGPIQWVAGAELTVILEVDDTYPRNDLTAG